MGGVERGQRNVGVVNLHRIAKVLRIRVYATTISFGGAYK